VCIAEFEQIQRSGTFEYGGGAEGKYFWESLEDAIAWSKQFPGDRVVSAEYLSSAADEFWQGKLDGPHDARFADLTQMNKSLIRIVAIPFGFSTRKS
jgi:hypothetical protein